MTAYSGSSRLAAESPIDTGTRNGSAATASSGSAIGRRCTIQASARTATPPAAAAASTLGRSSGSRLLANVASARTASAGAASIASARRRRSGSTSANASRRRGGEQRDDLDRRGEGERVKGAGKMARANPSDATSDLCGIALPKRDERRWHSRSGRYRGAVDGDRLSSEACSRSSASA